MSVSKSLVVLFCCISTIATSVPADDDVVTSDDSTQSLEELEALTQLESEPNTHTSSHTGVSGGLEALAQKLQGQLRSESQRATEQLKAELKAELKASELQHQHREWELEQKLKKEEWKTKQAESKLDQLNREDKQRQKQEPKSMERQLRESSNFLVDGQEPQDGIYLIRDPNAPRPSLQNLERESSDDKRNMQSKMASVLASQLGAQGMDTLTSAQASRALKAITLMKQKGTVSPFHGQDLLSSLMTNMESAPKTQDAITADDMKPFRGVLEEVIDDLNHIGTGESHHAAAHTSKHTRGDAAAEPESSPQNKVEITIKTN